MERKELALYSIEGDENKPKLALWSCMFAHVRIDLALCCFELALAPTSPKY
jgi:hypothetical protein